MPMQVNRRISLFDNTTSSGEVKLAKPASLGGVQFDAIIKRERSYEADVPEYPTEGGFYVADSILRRPLRLTVTAFISDTPVTWKSLFWNTKGRKNRVIKELEDLYFAGKPVSFETSSKVYPNMAIASLVVPEEAEMKNAVEVQIELKQVMITETKTTTIPDSYGLSGDTGASGGSANTTEENQEESEGACSLLYGLL